MNNLTKIIPLLFCATTFAIAVELTSPGSFTPFSGCKIEIINEGESAIKFTIGFPWRPELTLAAGPTNPVQIHPGWFFYPESKDRVWFYNGAKELTLYQNSYLAAGAYEVSHTEGQWLKSQVPFDVATRVSPEMLAIIRGDKVAPNHSPEPTPGAVH